jgi:hypothetical protein
VVREGGNEVVEAVRGEDQLYAGGERTEKREDVAARTRIESVGELIEHEDARAAHERPRDQQTAQLTERERTHLAAREGADVEPLDDRLDRRAAFV